MQHLATLIGEGKRAMAMATDPTSAPATEHHNAVSAFLNASPAGPKGP